LQSDFSFRASDMDNTYCNPPISNTSMASITSSGVAAVLQDGNGCSNPQERQHELAMVPLEDRQWTN
jgi:hypothetical protein